MLFPQHLFWLALTSPQRYLVNAATNAKWQPPHSTRTNNFDFSLKGHGVNGFVYNSSLAVAGYNYCNMPHVTPSTYETPDLKMYSLEHVEVIHRHHKRTPYASNTFPREDRDWDCSNTRFRVYMDSVHGVRFNERNNIAAVDTYWKTYNDELNPLKPEAYRGDCQFPQITAEGLKDSLDHGRDLYAVYGHKLGFLPRKYNASSVLFRVTSNVITSQVAGALTRGMFPHVDSIPLLQQYSDIDSLEPSYSCQLANDIRRNITNSELWKKHLEVSKDLAARLDAISGVNPEDPGWHSNWDHYFDSFTSRMCHGIPLPCSVKDPTKCVAAEDVEQVFRWGQWEYSYLYRDMEETLDYARLRVGVFLTELVGHLNRPDVKYRHNIGHDGSISLLLATLQVDEMVWPGMGAEVVVELWRKRSDHEKDFVRVLWGGKVMTSSALGKIDMISLEAFTEYLTALTGVGASEVVKLCGYEK